MRIVRIRREMPAVVGISPDGELREYGPFRPGQLWCLPDQVAQVMLERGWAEEP